MTAEERSLRLIHILTRLIELTYGRGVITQLRVPFMMKEAQLLNLIIQKG